MEAKTQDCRRQEFGTDRRRSWSLHRERPVSDSGFFTPRVEREAVSRNSLKASPTQASCCKFCSPGVSSRNARKYMKRKTRCHGYPSQNWEGYFAVFGSFQGWF